MQPFVDVAAQMITCPGCRVTMPARLLPLFVVTGASGVGKTAVVPALRECLPAWEIFETDILHGADWQQVKCNWLRVAYAIAQSGRHTILCGTILPEQLTQCDHHSLFRHIYYLNLHCDDATRAARLRARPAWRGCDEAFIDQQRRFAGWLLDHAATAFDPPLPTVDTSYAAPAEVARHIGAWALGYAMAKSVN
jgi:hypothetical protein